MRASASPCEGTVPRPVNCMSNAHFQRLDRFDSGDYADPFAGTEEYERRIKEAVAVLKAFDAEHPEAAAQAAAERDRAVRRALEGRD